MNRALLSWFAFGVVIGLVIVGGSIIAQPLLMRYESGGTAGYCPMMAAFPTSFHGHGFVTNNERQFVIAPNSTAFLTIDYGYMSISAESIAQNKSMYFKPAMEWIKIVTPQSNHYTTLSPVEAGLLAAPVDVTVTGNTSLSATFEVSALSSAPSGTYYAPFWSICGSGLLITVGYSLYTGPMSNNYF